MKSKHCEGSPAFFLLRFYVVATAAAEARAAEAEAEAVAAAAAKTSTTLPPIGSAIHDIISSYAFREPYIFMV